MKNVRLVLGSTTSVPVGLPDEETEKIYQQSCKPYLRSAYRAESVPLTLHLSGHFLEWIDKHHSEYTDVLLEMVRRKQVELLGGGFYDPVLSLIPRPDRIGQIESMTTLLRKRFGRRPRGIWITESVWEPNLTSTLRSCGMEYLFLDDYHFITAGLTGTDICRPFLTEDQGKVITVFPVCSELVGLARSGKPGDVISFLKSHRSDDHGIVFTLIEDGSRLGTQGIEWFDRFLELIGQNNEWLEVTLPFRQLREARPRRRVYFQSASYLETFSDALTADRRKAYDSLKKRFANESDTNVFGGRFRGFLTRYGESNRMYSKMQYTHVLVNQIRGDKYRRQAAREELWRGQAHGAYWHGVHAGVYDVRLRSQVYQSLIEAEKITRERGVFIPSVITVDFDMDGMDEYLYQGSAVNVGIHREGGEVFELDHLSSARNYVNTMHRTPEPYHTAATKKLGYDAKLRNLFMDRFLDSSISVAEFQRVEFSDLGGFTDTLYDQVDYKREGKRLVLRADSVVDGCMVGLQKRFTFRRAGIQVDYRLTNDGDTALEAVFSPECNLSFSSQEANALRVFTRAGKKAESEVSPAMSTHRGIGGIRFHDLSTELSVILSGSDIDEIWCMPVETQTMHDGKQRRMYQGACLVPRWPLNLEPGSSADLSLSLVIE